MFQGIFDSRVVVVATLLMLTATAPGCRGVDSRETQEVLPELKLEGVRFRVHRGGSLRALGQARSVALRRDSTRLMADGLSAVLPRGGGDVLVTAPEGEGVVSARTYSASGGVTLSRGQDVVRTDRVRWEPSEPGGLLTGDDPIVVEGRGYRLEGTGFVLDPASSELTIRGDARLVAGRGVGR